MMISANRRNTPRNISMICGSVAYMDSSDRASRISSRSIDEKGVVRSLTTMYCTTPRASQSRQIVPSMAIRCRNSSENTSEVSTTSTFSRKTSGDATMN